MLTDNRTTAYREMCIRDSTVDSWLIWRLTGGRVHITDYTNASRTMLYNIEKLDWDDRILNALDIPRSILPRVADSSQIYGTFFLDGAEIPIGGVAGDQQAALFGQACFRQGDAKNTYGTGCFLLMNTGDRLFRSKSGLLSTIAVGLDGKVSYALEGSVFVGGAIVQWLRDEMGFFSESCDSEYFASKVKDNGGVYVVPAFTGLGDVYKRQGKSCPMALPLPPRGWTRQYSQWSSFFQNCWSWLRLKKHVICWQTRWNEHAEGSMHWNM